jgi:hypothetical protein
MSRILQSSYDNQFDLITGDVSDLQIVENRAGKTCYIKDKTLPNFFYNLFLLSQNSKTKIICEITFYESSVTGKYMPRLAFKKTDINGNLKDTAITKPTIIDLKDSKQAVVFWKMMGFLNLFKDLVDLGEFDRSYEVYSKEKYFVELQSKKEKDKIEEVKELIIRSDLKEGDIKSIVFENRKKTVRSFFYLLKNIDYKGKSSQEHYRAKYVLSHGEESVWHHFLKHNDWILGLNVDVKFISDFYDEQKVGSENSKGRTSPKTDILGISNYTTLIELKHSTTEIFKKEKSKGRANTWDFSSDFIQGLSQCLGQKVALEKSFESKVFINEDNKRLDKNRTKTVDPKVVFIIGNRSIEFPHDLKDENYIKSETFELMRRNNRNIDIITFDELFERAYHIVYSEKIEDGWFQNSSFLRE